MKIFIPVILVIVFAVGVYLYTRRKSSPKSAVDISGCRWDTTTPCGVRIHSVNPVRAEMIEACDRAHIKLFELARARGYTRKLGYGDFDVYIIPPVREFDSLGNYEPNFALRADDYDGSIYDHDPAPGIGQIYAAEYVLQDFSGFVVAEWTRDFESLGAVGGAFHNGREHLLLRDNDEKLFEATKNHANGGGHPIIF